MSSLDQIVQKALSYSNSMYSCQKNLSQTQQRAFQVLGTTIHEVGNHEESHKIEGRDNEICKGKNPLLRPRFKKPCDRPFGIFKMGDVLVSGLYDTAAEGSIMSEKLLELIPVEAYKSYKCKAYVYTAFSGEGMLCTKKIHVDCQSQIYKFNDSNQLQDHVQNEPVISQEIFICKEVIG